MTPKTLAAQLNGRSYCHEITKEEEAIAKAAGLVVAFGASDDLLELRGAICDELGAYDGQTVHLTKEGLLENECGDEDCPHFERLKAAAVPLEILWHDECDGPCWTFNTTIPHEAFEIFEDGELYCRGIVFALADVPTQPSASDHDMMNLATRVAKLERLAALLGAAWFYGGFVAETHNEREQEALMRELGFVFASEDELVKVLNPDKVEG